MNVSKSTIYLIDLPTFPKGVMSLTFPAIASCFDERYTVNFLDLNFATISTKEMSLFTSSACCFIGIKVSAQNYKFAISLTRQIKSASSSVIVIWGGEYPSLLPEEACEYADGIVVGSFENVAEILLDDLEKNTLKKIYKNESTDCIKIKTPKYSIYSNSDKYIQAMGFPMETSKGCDKKCTFCMVHTMQPLSNFKTREQLTTELSLLSGKFVNVVDYNLGMDNSHLNNVIEAFTESSVLGWMGEMCIENLDNDLLLAALAKSRCKIIYCGLESVSEDALLSVNKAKTNVVDNYVRIIKKVQSYGIQLAAGVIIGLAGEGKMDIDNTFSFYQKMGLIYAKITFLTYNPGTKVHQSMKRVGNYTTNEIDKFDGNHLTFLHDGQNREELIEALIHNIKVFYSNEYIQQRTENAGVKGDSRNEFINFNCIYRDVYLNWIKKDIFNDEEGFKELLETKLEKSDMMQQWDEEITTIRKKLFLQTK